jgi:heme o synthase
VPMMPVVRGPDATTRLVLGYAIVLVAVTLLPGALGTFGLFYLGAAGLLGGMFLVLAWRLWRESSPAHAGVLFHFSLLYLALLFVAVAIDAAVR